MLSSIKCKLPGSLVRFQVPRCGSLILSRHSSNTVKSDPDQKLRNDIKQLGTILGISIKEYDPEVFEGVEKMRLLGREWRLPDGDKAAFEKMVEEVKSLKTEKLLGISRSFANFLALANAAENHHRVRRLKNSITSSNSALGLWPKEDSCAGSIQQLIKDGIPPQKVIQALKEQSVEVVLTAHPTEVNRRTMLRKYSRIQELLSILDGQDLTLFERKRLNQEIAAEVSCIWDSDDLRRRKPTPVDEAKTGLAIVENVLWSSVPAFLRKLNDVVLTECGESLPLDMAPIKIASWMGGDRDGNPNVTPPITLEVSMLSRWMAATLFKNDIATLRASISLRTCSQELRDVTNNSREPYRDLLKVLEARLNDTIHWADLNLAKITPNSTAVPVPPGALESNRKPILKSSELMEPLLLMHRSLMSTGFKDVADGPLVDTIRRVAVFGLALMPLDIRQESTRHTEALDSITRYLGLGSYASWDEPTRREWLQKELQSKRPLLPRHYSVGCLGFSATVQDTLKTFELAATLEEGSLGAYVISQCQQASDVLAVMLLQQDAGVFPAMRVVPLFETLDDLQRAPATVDALFGMSTYKSLIGGHQEIMVGYSDSAKDAGRLAASWAQYNAQVDMIAAADKHGVNVTFFHGKGGTVGRGGNPAVYHAILAHPPHTINGRFRVTEQGEMITQNLGERSIAIRTLDLFTAGVLAERFLQRPAVKPEWSAMMETLSEVSCEAYRKVVRGEPRFVPYFRTATPELELAGLNVGSRPAKRNPKGGVESLRAIPWVFSWTQTRLNLPTWLGVGEAVGQQLKEHPEVLRDMYANWPWFRTLIDLLEMILVKSDLKIAENYDKQLVTDPESLALGEELRVKMRQTEAAVLAVSGNPFLQANNALLLRSLAVRNPYIDPLNVIQSELLRRLRLLEKEQEKEEVDGKKGTDVKREEELTLLRDALLVTINGVANGMRNSG
mmetsp:Transcript_28874/g.41145  ORF Transcript_28874/g.41145 Transcript_28874/m.41145 type:complete len:959 (+) Transcript_28874:68-2944(+)